MDYWGIIAPYLMGTSGLSSTPGSSAGDCGTYTQLARPLLSHTQMLSEQFDLVLNNKQ